MSGESILWILLVVVILIAVLVTIVLVRTPRAFDSAAKVLRDEVRLSREEADRAARNLREEVMTGLAGRGDEMSRGVLKLMKREYS